jgi:zinc transport system substrate-binding protein
MPLFTRLLLCLLPLLASLAQAGVTPLAVSVSVLPQKYLVERVGGRWVKVYTMVSGGKDPHTFEPTPAQVAQLAQAQLYFATGMSFEQAWLGKLRSGKTTRVVDMRQGIKLRQQEEMLELNSGHEHEEHGGSDPHVWTSPANLRIIAATIQRELGKSLPAESQSELQQNTQNLLRDIERSEQKIKAQLAKSPVKRFMVFHPSWGYFADAYGLQQLPIEYEGKEPGPRTLAQIIRIGKREQIKVVFVQPQFSARAASNIASGLNARVEKLDDLAENVLANLESAAAAIAASR